MADIKILSNQNRIIQNHSINPGRTLVNEDLSIRFIFHDKEEYQIGRRSLVLDPESFLILNKNTSYKQLFQSGKKAQSLTLVFSQLFIETFNKELDYRNNYLLSQSIREGINQQVIAERLFPLSGDIRFNLRHLKNYLGENGSDELLLNEYMRHCLLNCYMIYGREMLDAGRKLKTLNENTKKEILRRLNLAKEYLDANFAISITLDDVAAYSSFSVNHLIRTFSQAFDLTPHQYLINLRLQKAKNLLKNTGHPVNEVGGLVGFESTSSFIRLFREHYKTTPLKFRITSPR